MFPISFLSRLMTMIDGFQAMNRVLEQAEKMRMDNLTSALPPPWDTMPTVVEPNRFGKFLFPDDEPAMNKQVLETAESKQKTQRMQSRVEKTSGNEKGHRATSRHGGHGQTKATFKKGGGQAPKQPQQQQSRKPRKAHPKFSKKSTK